MHGICVQYGPPVTALARRGLHRWRAVTPPSRPLQRWPTRGYTVGGRRKGGAACMRGMCGRSAHACGTCADMARRRRRVCRRAASGKCLHGHRAMRMGMRCVGLCCRACANGALAVWGDGAMRRSGDWAAGGASGGQASTHPVKSLKSPGPVWPSTAVRRPLAGAESSVFST